MLNAEKCCGCYACKAICPRNAIEWVYDQKGFGKPVVGDNCVGCGLCEKVCPMNEDTHGSRPISVYAAYSEERQKSTSGGISFELAKHTIDKNGMVVGVTLQDDFSAKHVCANDLRQVEPMRDSKYIQSEMIDVYKNVQEALKTGRKVLFTGTPCQVRALDKYLHLRKVNSTELVLCDVICHGVGSPKIFQDYIALCQKYAGKRIVGHKFRHKALGWHRTRDCNIFEDGDYDYSSHVSEIYTHIYDLDNVCQRGSCTECPFTSYERCSDITIGDFWGIEKIMPEFDDDCGVSVVLCNTEKGKCVLQEVSSNLTIAESTLENAAVRQPHLQRPVQYGKKYQQFWNIYEKKGFECVARKMYQYGWKYDMIRTVKSLLRPIKKAFKRR